MHTTASLILCGAVPSVAFEDTYELRRLLVDIGYISNKSSLCLKDFSYVVVYDDGSKILMLYKAGLYNPLKRLAQ